MNAPGDVGRVKFLDSIRTWIEPRKLFTVFTWCAGISFVPLLFLGGNGQDYFVYARSGGLCVEISHIPKGTDVLTIEKWPGKDLPASWYRGSIGVQGPPFGLMLAPDSKANVSKGAAPGRPVVLWLRADRTAPLSRQYWTPGSVSALIPFVVNISTWRVEDWEIERVSLILPLLWFLVFAGLAIKRLVTLPDRFITRRRMLAGKCVECGYDLRDPRLLSRMWP